MNKPSQNETVAADRVPVREKLAYGAASYADNIMQNGIGQMANPVFNIGLGVNPALLGVALALPRLWDAVTDLFVGSLTDNARTRWGRRRPFIFVGALASAAIFITLWQVQRGWSEWAYFAWFLGFALLFYTAYTFFAMPFIAMGFELSPDYNERTRIMAVRTFFGALSGISIQWMFFFTQRSWFTDTVSGMRVVSIWIGLTIAALGIMPALFIRDRNVALVKKQVKVPLRRSLNETVAQPVFRRLLLALVTLVIGLFTVNSLGFYVNAYHVFGGDLKAASLLQGLGGTTYQVSSMIAVPFIVSLSQRFGKRRTLLGCLMLPLAGTVLKWWCFDPRYPYLQLVTYALMGPGIASLWTLLGSMVADICDQDELAHGVRREGMFSAIYGWVFKLGLSLATVLGGFVLAGSGFDATRGAAQDPQALFWMRAIFSFVPACGILSAIVIIAGYPLTQETARTTRTELERRRGTGGTVA